jgi:CRISPR-associated endonuclease Csn1
MKGRTLGLDIGSRSIGWALVETEDRERIVAMGVRVFPEGVDRDTKGMEKSKNATRREARGARRM